MMMNNKSNNNNDQKVRALLQISGNSCCADCDDNRKGAVKFCSVKLGVFLCNQCYAAHRALGAHITRGKCIGLDTFSDLEVDLLTRLGNIKVNGQYEATLPQGNKPPPTPCNGCSSISCQDCKQRLQFITNKYEKKLWYSEMVQPTSTTTISASTAHSNNSDDPFGLFSNTNISTLSSTQPSQQTSKKPSSSSSSPNDADFFASFGL